MLARLALPQFSFRWKVRFFGPYAISGYEAMHMIRKGQVRWLAKGDVVGQVRFIKQTLGIAA